MKVGDQGIRKGRGVVYRELFQNEEVNIAEWMGRGRDEMKVDHGIGE